nr:MAG TPA: hypothetical protein [Caudoviricetes sp.]
MTSFAFRKRTDKKRKEFTPYKTLLNNTLPWQIGRGFFVCLKIYCYNRQNASFTSFVNVNKTEQLLAEMKKSNEI